MPIRAFDDFERLNLGPDWYAIGPIVIRNDSDLGVSGGGLGASAFVAQQFGPDQYSEGIVSSDFPGVPSGLQVCAREQPDRSNGNYCFHYDPRDLEWQIKLDGIPSGTPLARTAGTPVVGGDVLRIEAQGSTIRGYRNGTLYLTATHSLLTSGHPSLNMRSSPQPAPPMSGFESWTGGDL